MQTKTKTTITVTISEDERRALDLIIDCTPTTRAEHLRQLLRADLQRRRDDARRAAAAKPAEPVHTEEGLVIDGVLYTADEALTPFQRRFVK